MIIDFFGRVLSVFCRVIQIGVVESWFFRVFNIFWIYIDLTRLRTRKPVNQVYSWTKMLKPGLVKSIYPKILRKFFFLRKFLARGYDITLSAPLWESVKLLHGRFIAKHLPYNACILKCKKKCRDRDDKFQYSQ